MKNLIVLILLIYTRVFTQNLSWYLPIQTDDRQSWEEIRLTAIGEFSKRREARPKIPAHLHTGLDLQRPSKNYDDEPVFPAAPGIVISMRDDGPFAQIIIGHHINENETEKVWTIYEHISGICVVPGDTIDPFRPIARFMNNEELDLYGRHFDHVHFEIMKAVPYPIKPDSETPFRFYGTYWFDCYTEAGLKQKYFHPRSFLEARWRKENK